MADSEIRVVNQPVRPGTWAAASQSPGPARAWQPCQCHSDSRSRTVTQRRPCRAGGRSRRGRPDSARGRRVGVPASDQSSVDCPGSRASAITVRAPGDSGCRVGPVTVTSRRPGSGRDRLAAWQCHDDPGPLRPAAGRPCSVTQSRTVTLGPVVPTWQWPGPPG